MSAFLAEYNNDEKECKILIIIKWNKLDYIFNYSREKKIIYAILLLIFIYIDYSKQFFFKFSRKICVH